MTNENINEKKQTKQWTEPETEDRGFAWIVLIGCFFTQMFVLGTLKTYGILYTEMVEHFSSGSGNTAWIGSIAWCLLLGFGPVSNHLSVRFSFRQVTLVGGIFVGTGYFLSGFVMRMEHMYLTFTLCGIGYGLSFASSSTIINYYFKKRRTLANAIMLSGSSFGAILFPFLYRFLIDTYGLLWALRIIGAIVSNICVAGSVFRQPAQLIRSREQLIRSREQVDTKRNTTTNACDNKSDKNSVSKKGDEIKHLKKTDTCCGCGELGLRLPLFTNRRFVTLVIAFMFGMFGHVSNTTLIPAHVKAIGYDNKYAAISVSIYGGAEIIARLFLGWVADLNFVKRKNIFVVCMIVGGVFSIIAPLFDDFTYMAIYAAASAAFPSSFLTLIAVLVIEVVGMDNFPSAFGLITMFRAFPSVVTQPICGWLKDYYGNWHPAFILTGTVFLCAGVIVLLEPLLLRCHTMRCRARQKYRVSDDGPITTSVDEEIGVETQKAVTNNDHNAINGLSRNNYLNPAFRNDDE